ncbi:FUSC family protein [Arthrobacter sp. USHLN218]|uniref:FUSC family protein n=1 Tax=Arthrobacter sp. USHLN218 TaxID=3081232 RepID=UPI00301A90FA
MFTVAPAQNDHLPALRVALSVAAPSLVLLALGRPDLIIYAVFGAFTAMYGRAESHQLRLRHQLQASCLLVAGVGTGILLSAHHVDTWALVATEAAFAALASLQADRAGLRPVGPFFSIFALGACASVPLSIAPWAALLITAGSAAFSVLVGFAGWTRTRSWVPGAVRQVPPLRGPYLAGAATQAGRYLIAVAAAGGIGLLAGIGHPHWAMAAAAVPLAVEGTRRRVYRGIHRILGTFAGLGVTALVLFADLNPTVLALLVIAFQFPTELYMARHYGLALVFFTPLILIMTQLAAPADTASLIVNRGLETFLGALAGIATVLLLRSPPNKSSSWISTLSLIGGRAGGSAGER